MTDIVERLRATELQVWSLDKEAADEIERLRQICRNAYEVYAGSEGVPEPLFASEAYVLSLLMAMVEEVKKGLK